MNNCYTLNSLGEVLQPKSNKTLNYNHIVVCDKCITLINTTINQLTALGMMPLEVKDNIKQSINTTKEQLRKSINCTLQDYISANNTNFLSLNKLAHDEVQDVLIAPISDYSLKADSLLLKHNAIITFDEGESYIRPGSIGLSDGFMKELADQWADYCE